MKRRNKRATAPSRNVVVEPTQTAVRPRSHAQSDVASTVDAAANAAAWRARVSKPFFLMAAALATVTFAWAYWPVAWELVYVWNHEPDYSHGYFILPAALYFLWARRDRLPAPSDHMHWGGIVLLALSGAIRIAGSLWYIDALEAWSLPFWIAGACWLLGGRKLMAWTLPSVVFLAFMIPLPFRAEHLLSMPLQRVATNISCWLLQSLGRPAVAEGNVIFVNDITLEIAEACSGLRIFMSIAALAYLFMVLTKGEWWMKAVLAAAVLPIALATNAVRVVATGLLLESLSGETAHKLSHDAAGWLMMPLAAVLFAMANWYVSRLVVDVETVSPGELMLGMRAAGNAK